MNRLTKIESSRILAVVKELQIKLHLMGQLDFRALNDDQIERLGETPGSALMNQMSLEDQFDAVVTDPDEYDKQDRIDELAAQLNEAARLSARVLQDSPEAAALVERSGREMRGLMGVVDTLTDLLTQLETKLHTTVEEAKAREEFQRDLTAKIAKAEEEAKALSERLRAAKRDRRSETARQKEIVTKLEAELEYVRDTVKLESQSLRRVMEEQHETNTRQFEAKKASCTDAAGKLKDAVAGETKEHGESEEAARKRKVKLEVELQNLLAQYDTAMLERQGRVDEARERHAEEKVRLAQMQEYFDLIDRNLAVRAEEEKEEEAVRARERAELQKLSDAAAVIQLQWRKYSLAKKEKKKKKKGKKGKKGKKKK